MSVFAGSNGSRDKKHGLADWIMLWQTWKRMLDPVLHIDLRNWADIMVVAPLDANTLAKLANGLSDNFLVSRFGRAIGP